MRPCTPWSSPAFVTPLEILPTLLSSLGASESTTDANDLRGRRVLDALGSDPAGGPDDQHDLPRLRCARVGCRQCGGPGQPKAAP